MTIRDYLKRVRDSQPFNRLTTSAFRSLFRATGFRSELVTRKLRRVGEVEARLPNGRTLRLWTENDDQIPNRIFWDGWDGFERETIPLFYRLAECARVTFDVGAHVGTFSLLAAHANLEGRVYAFEPMPGTFERLRRNVAMNGLANVRCANLAVGQFKTTSRLFYETGTAIPGEASLRRECTEAFRWASPGGEISETEVAVTTLDEFVRENDLAGVDLVKIDTEGTEPEVLRGLADTLRRDRPDVVCEVLKGFATEAGLDEVLRPLGYRYYVLTPEGPAPRAIIEGQPDGRWDLRNYLFSRRGPEDVMRLFNR
jgi:FkbM family methyltransferase